MCTGLTNGSDTWNGSVCTGRTVALTRGMVVGVYRAYNGTDMLNGSVCTGRSMGLTRGMVG